MPLFSRRRREPLTVSHVDGAAKREAENAARRDGKIDPPITPPADFQKGLQAKCSYALDKDMERRQDEFAQLLAAELSNRKEFQYVTRRLASAKQTLKGIEHRFAQLPRPQWPGRLHWGWKWALLLGLGLFEYYLVRTALDVLSIKDYVKDAIALLLGVVPIVAIELHGAHILDFYTYHKEDLEKRREWILNAVVLAVLTASIMGFIVAMGVVRGQGFSRGSGLFRHVPASYAPTLAITLALLQLVATAAALAITRQQARADEWRQVESDLKASRREVGRLDRALPALDDDYANLLARHLCFRSRVEEHHRSILDHFADRDACYRVVFSRIHPDLGPKFDLWSDYENATLTRFEPLYRYFGPPGADHEPPEAYEDLGELRARAEELARQEQPRPTQTEDDVIASTTGSTDPPAETQDAPDVE